MNVRKLSLFVALMLLLSLALAACGGAAETLSLIHI